MSMLARVRTWARGLGPWAGHALAFILGALATVALAPTFVTLSLFPVFSLLFWLLHGRAGPRMAFFTGFFFGLGFFIAGLYWIGFAFLTYPDRFGWMAPFAVLGLASVLALYPACVGALVRALVPCTGSGTKGVLVFAALWVLGEWLRGWLFTGFPWNPVGMALAFSDALIQPAAVGGVYGLSLFVVLLATTPVLFASYAQSARRAAFLLVGFAVLVWGGGAWHLSSAKTETHPDVTLRLVQPNIDQKLKWRPSLRHAHVVRQVELSRLPATTDTPPTHVIWAETAVPFYLASDPERLALVARAVPKDGLLITGAPRIERKPAPRPGESPVRVWNSLHAVDGQGRIIATYDKAHLVPFGEYMPFRAWLSRFMNVSKITAGSTDFSAGPGPLNMDMGRAGRASPLICYEGIFPGAVTASAARPDWLLNITNDGWYGRTAGPYQHFQQVRMRAVEEGVPVVRVANTGISGVIDGYGRITHVLPLGTEGIIDAPLPRARAATVFARTGNGPVITLCFLMGLLGFFRWPRSVSRA